ncbi:transposase [Dactylosporangium sp. NPDC051484]|uniref:transposase n=1 Tax=Dactylosporangium sp. NPDC051484 TaxID=3154942 RepID=UPI00344FE460
MVPLGRPSKYTEGFRRDAVELVRSSSRPINQVARELGMSHETLRKWVRSEDRRSVSDEFVCVDDGARYCNGVSSPHWPAVSSIARASSPARSRGSGPRRGRRVPAAPRPAVPAASAGAGGPTLTPQVISPDASARAWDSATTRWQTPARCQRRNRPWTAPRYSEKTVLEAVLAARRRSPPHRPHVRCGPGVAHWRR